MPWHDQSIRISLLLLTAIKKDTLKQFTAMIFLYLKGLPHRCMLTGNSSESRGIIAFFLAWPTTLFHFTLKEVHKAVNDITCHDGSGM
jgi:hypothetical protein